MIQTRIINSSEFRTAKVVAAYFAIGSEVRTDYIMKTAFKNHKVEFEPINLWMAPDLASDFF